MNKKKIIILISVALIIVISFLFKTFYLDKANYYGPVHIELQDPETNIYAYSPLNKRLEFNKDSINEKTISFNYPHKRFYNKIIVESKFKLQQNDISSVFNKSNLNIESLEFISNKDGNFVYAIVLNKNYSFVKKTINLIELIYLKTYKLIYIIIIFAFAFSIFYKRKNILVLFKRIPVTTKLKVNISTPKRRLLLSSIALVIAILTGLFYYSYFEKDTLLQLNNEVSLKNGRDQYDYHTMAVNLSNGNGFLINGKTNPKIDYKINSGNKTGEKFNVELLTGIRNYNRFPGYPILISAIYKCFHSNPISVKIWQIALLCFIVFMFPFLGYKLWRERGFWAGFITASFLLIYLFPYSILILPDTLTTFINFIILWFYIDLRKQFSFRNVIISAILLGISFLIKASLIIILPLILIDIVYLSWKNGLKKSLLKFAIYIGLFFLMWLPYNIWSYNSFNKDVKTCEEIFKIANKKPSEINYTDLERFTFNGSSKKLFENITEDEILIFKNEIEPFIEKTHYLPYGFSSYNYSDNIIALSYCKLITFNTKPYFMISLISNYGALECHNEYVNNGGITNKWLNEPNSFYNNDNLVDKSNAVRVANFYLNNPSLMYQIIHFKLEKIQECTSIISIYSFILLIGIIIYSLRNVQSKHYKYLAIILSLGLLITSTIYPIIYIYIYVLSLLLFLLIKKREIRKALPLFILCVSGIFYILLSFSSHRYLTYYTFPLYLLSAYIALSAIKELLSLLSTDKNLENTTDNVNLIEN